MAARRREERRSDELCLRAVGADEALLAEQLLQQAQQLLDDYAAAASERPVPSGACAIEDTWTPPPLPGWLEAPDDAPSVKARILSL